ncbi:MAG: cell wall hydrolase [Gammaproteobacteria bacterium]|nr:cell wall hydrolase [Gammaproteobacteria bacterium]
MESRYAIRSSDNWATILLVDVRVWVTLLLLIGMSLAASKGWAHSQSNRSAECLALAMYWEARGEGTLGMKAVGAVVLNRVRHPDFPSSVCGVVFQGGETPPCQFSWWCDGKSDRPRNAAQWRHALNTAENLLARRRRDPTRGALYFHSTSAISTWHRRQHPTVRIGRHRFYR